MDVLRVIGIIHDSHLDWEALLLGLEVDDIVEEMGAVTVDVAHKLLESVLGVEHFLASLALFVGAKVAQRYLDTCVEECKLAHTACHDVPLIVGGSEYCGVWPELLACTSKLCLAYNLHGIEGLALLVFLLIDFAIAEHLRLHMCGESIDTAHAHTVQTTADLI